METEPFDIALSFAGEDRAYVAEVARLLRANDVRVFYDDYEKVDLWGKNLYTHLRDIYQRRAKFTVMFISEQYAKKLWTNHERESAQARAFDENREYILPARFDDAEVPGLLKTTGYLDLRQTSPAELVEAILQKLGREPVASHMETPGSQSTRAVVLEQWLGVERGIERLAEHYGAFGSPNSHMARQLNERGILPVFLLAEYRSLRKLRDEAVHAHIFQLDPDALASFSLRTEALRTAILRLIPTDCA